MINKEHVMRRYLSRVKMCKSTTRRRSSSIPWKKNSDCAPDWHTFDTLYTVPRLFFFELSLTKRTDGSERTRKGGLAAHKNTKRLLLRYGGRTWYCSWSRGISRTPCHDDIRIRVQQSTAAAVWNRYDRNRNPFDKHFIYVFSHVAVVLFHHTFSS